MILLWGMHFFEYRLKNKQEKQQIFNIIKTTKVFGKEIRFCLKKQNYQFVFGKIMPTTI